MCTETSQKEVNTQRSKKLGDLEFIDHLNREERGEGVRGTLLGE